MTGAPGARVREELSALGRVLANPDLRRLQLAHAGAWIGQWAAQVAVGVYAFEVGGAALVGFAFAVRMLPSALAAPLASTLADRHPRRRVMLTADLVVAAALATAAVSLALDGPPWVVFAAWAVLGIVLTAFESARRALVPSLARDPEELVAANVASSTIDGVSVFLGPAVGGALLAATAFEWVFVATAAAFAGSAYAVARIAKSADREVAGAQAHEPFALALRGGLSAVRASPTLRVILGLLSAQVLVCGALNVLIVALALEVLRTGELGVGLLNSAIGVGALAGTLLALVLTRAHGLALTFTLGLALWGLPIVLAGLWPRPGPALVLMGVLGLGNTLVDVAGFTLIQRAAPAHVLARVFGILESLMLGSLALGAALTPVLIGAVGIRAACVVVGLVLPLLALLLARRLARIESQAAPPEHALELLRAVPMFASLSPPTLETLAAKLDPIRFASAETVIAQGAPGERFFMIDEGEARVVVDGREVARQTAGDHFGEIALLRDVPRTATVVAGSSGLAAFALEREDFLSVVTGHAESAASADGVVAVRLERARPSVASI